MQIRQAIDLFAEGMEVKDIADKLDIPVGTLRWWFSREDVQNLLDQRYLDWRDEVLGLKEENRRLHILESYLLSRIEMNDVGDLSFREVTTLYNKIRYRIEQRRRYRRPLTIAEERKRRRARYAEWKANDGSKKASGGSEQVGNGS